MTEPQQRIAIVGGNFAGLTAAIKLSRRHAVTVIDPSPSMVNSTTGTSCRRAMR